MNEQNPLEHEDHSKHWSPHNAKVVWVVVMLLMVFVSGGLAHYVLMQSGFLFNEIGSIVHMDRERVAGVKSMMLAPKDFMNTQWNIYGMKKEQPILWTKLHAPLPFTIAYPLGWHVTTDITNLKPGRSISIVIHNGPILSFNGANVEPGSMGITNITLDMGETFDDAVNEVTSRLKDSTEETIKNRQGIDILKVTGSYKEIPETLHPNDSTTFYFIRSADLVDGKSVPAVIIANVYPSDTPGGIVEPDNAREILEEMLMNLDLQPST